MANKISSKDNAASPVSEMTDHITGQSVVMTVTEQKAKRGRLFSQNIKKGFFILPKHVAFSSLAIMLFFTSNMAYAAADICGSSFANGARATACGNNARATENYSVALGFDANATSNHATATGPNAQATAYKSTAIGSNSEASGRRSTAIGQESQATGVNSTATGHHTYAAGENSVALGSYSRAKRDNEVNIGIWPWDLPTTVDSSHQLTRTLSGLSDGVNPDEAVNKKQLDDIASELTAYGNQYTDNIAVQTLQSANDHSEQRAVVAEDHAVIRAAAYTDKSATATLEKANSYTDNRATATLEKANSYSNQRAVQAENNAVARSNRYTNHRVNALKQQMDRNEKRANGGIAGAMAMSAIAGTGSGFGMAISGYRDQGAIAAGIQKSLTPDTSVNLKATWDSGNGVGVAAGFFTSW